MSQHAETQKPSPSALLGAGKQSEHVLRLLQWKGISTRDIALFDDAHPRMLVGALGHTVRGSLQEGIAWVIQQNLPAMVALGSRHAAVRYATFRLLREAGVITPNVIHPSCSICPEATLGPNTSIMPGCVIGPGVRVGALATFFSAVTIEHDCVIGENVTFGPNATLSGSVEIGSHSFIGSAATIAPGVKIGERVLIGAGAVVVDDIPAGAVAFGVPARVFRRVRDGDDVPTEATLRELVAAVHLKISSGGEI